MSNELELRVQNLEIKLSFQDDLLEQLNEVVIQQQKHIDFLESKLKKVESQIRSQEGSHFKSITEEEPPPHY